jgi:hypothetical protein
MRGVRFQVAAIHREGPRLFVAGRNCGDALAVGDVMTGPDGDVRVEAILTYRRYVNVIDGGMTAEIELSGGGIAAIQPNSDLRGTLETALPSLELLGEGEFHVRPV